MRTMKISIPLKVSVREEEGGVYVVNRLEVGQEKCVSNSGEAVRGIK